MDIEGGGARPKAKLVYYNITEIGIEDKTKHPLTNFGQVCFIDWSFLNP